MTKEFLTKNLSGSRPKLWVLLNENRLFGVEDQNVKAESLRFQTTSVLRAAEDV